MLGMAPAELRTRVGSPAGQGVLAFRTRASMQLGILALGRQLTVYQRAEAGFVIAWQRREFREHWAARIITTKGEPPDGPTHDARAG